MDIKYLNKIYAIQVKVLKVFYIIYINIYVRYFRIKLQKTCIRQLILYFLFYTHNKRDNILYICM